MKIFSKFSNLSSLIIITYLTIKCQRISCVLQSSSNYENHHGLLPKLFGVLIIANTISLSYTNPPSVLAQKRKDEKEEASKKNLDLPIPTEYFANNGNSSFSNDNDGFVGNSSIKGKSNSSSIYNGNNKVRSRTGRRRRLKASKSTRRKSRPYFHSRKSKKDRQGVNLDEVETFRREILSQLGAVDPLLCLPKALCGISSRQHHLSHKQSQVPLDGNGLGLGLDPMNEDVINNYFQIMRSVIPEHDIDNSNEKSPSTKKVKRKKKAGFDNDSDSESSEESLEDELSKESKESKSSSDEIIPRDDVEFYREKVYMDKLMKEEDYEPEPNWWDMLPNRDPFENEGGSGSSSGSGTTGSGSSSSWPSLSFLPKTITSMFGSVMPSMSWGFGNGNAPDVFGNDPFFTNFDGRSLGNNQRALKWSFGKSSRSNEGNKRKGNQKRIDRRNYLVRKRTKKGTKGRSKEYLDDRKGEVDQVDDPVERFQLAVEIGKKLDDPKQCDYIFNGCPFSYQEIIAIIDQTNSKKEDEGKEQQVEYTQVQTKENPEVISDGSTLKHSLPNGDSLEISLKVLDAKTSSNEPLLLRPKVSIIEHAIDSYNIQSMQDQSDQLAVEESNQVLKYRTDLDVPQNVSSDESLQEHENKSPDPPKKRRKIKVKPTKAPKRKRVRQKLKKPATKTLNQWGRRPSNQYSGPTYYHKIPQYLKTPNPHVTNYHYYNSNSPNMGYQPLPPPPPQNYPSHSGHQPHRASSPPQNDEPRPSPTTTTTPAPTPRPAAETSSEERIVIQLPAESPSNSYYNVFPNIPIPNLSSLTNYFPGYQSQTHQPQPQPQPYQYPPISTRPPPQNHFQHYRPNYYAPPPPTYPPQTYPPPMYPSMFSYFMGRK